MCITFFQIICISHGYNLPTSGQLKEVPLTAAYPLPVAVVQTELPGAQTSTKCPYAEKPDLESVEVDAPATIRSSASASPNCVRSRPSFPAAFTIRAPWDLQ